MLETTATRSNIAEIADRYAAAWLPTIRTPSSRSTPRNQNFRRMAGRDEVEGNAALRKEFAQIFERYPDFGVVTHRLLVGDNHWTLDWTSPSTARQDRRSFRALDVVEVDANGLVTRKDTFFDFAQVKAANEAA